MKAGRVCVFSVNHIWATGERHRQRPREKKNVECRLIFDPVQEAAKQQRQDSAERICHYSWMPMGRRGWGGVNNKAEESVGERPSREEWVNSNSY